MKAYKLWIECHLSGYVRGINLECLHATHREGGNRKGGKEERGKEGMFLAFPFFPSLSLQFSSCRQLLNYLVPFHFVHTILLEVVITCIHWYLWMYSQVTMANGRYWQLLLTDCLRCYPVAWGNSCTFYEAFEKWIIFQNIGHWLIYSMVFIFIYFYSILWLFYFIGTLCKGWLLRRHIHHVE